MDPLILNYILLVGCIMGLGGQVFAIKKQKRFKPFVLLANVIVLGLVIFAIIKGVSVIDLQALIEQA